MYGTYSWIALLSLIFKFHGSLAQDASCLRVDFNSATLSTLSRCEFIQEFVVKSYAPSFKFKPFRPNAEYYLSTQWEGLTCGETVESFSLNRQSELRMVYSLTLNVGATLEVRVLDLDKLDNNLNPMVVIRWKTEKGTSTGTWGLFRERMDSSVRRAKIQIEANMNTGSDLAIEYFTIFNYEVETDECHAIDEFAPVTTTEAEPVSSTTLEDTTLPAETTTMTLQASTTEENVYTSFATASSTETSVTSASTKAPSQVEAKNYSADWLWITLAALFASLLFLAAAGVIYIYVISKNLRTGQGYLIEEKFDQFESSSDPNQMRS